MSALSLCTVTSSSGERCTNLSNQDRTLTICATHEYRLRRYGDVQADRPIRKYTPRAEATTAAPYAGRSEYERFWTRVFKTSHCWLWTGSVVKNGGYGQARYGGFSKLAHRIAWEMAYGYRPDGERITQLCGNPRCVRLAHLVSNKPQIVAERLANSA